MTRIMIFVGALLMAFAVYAGDATNKVDKAVAKDGGERVWIVPEYYGMMAKDSPYSDSPLVTKGDPTLLTSGILGEPGTIIVFDDDKTDYGIQHGFKMTIGGWITEDRKWGGEVRGFYQPGVDESTTVAMDPNTILCVPYFDTQNGLEDCMWFDPILDRAASVRVGNEREFWGVSGSALYNVRRSDNLTMDALFGIRYLRLEDTLGYTINVDSDTLAFADVGLIDGTQTSRDTFEASNDFFGADIGLRIAYRSGRFRAEFQPRVAIGATMETVDIKGVSTAFDRPTGTSFARPGGFWALDTNMGKHEQTKFAVVPEAHLKIGYEVHKNIELIAGYSGMYWSSVVLAGHHLNRRINVDKAAIQGYGPLPTAVPAAPTVEMDTTNYWAHGVTAGIKIKF